MNSSRKLLVVAALGLAAMAPLSNAHAQRITVAIGDRPYYTRGSSYWNNDVRYVWVNGHPGRYGRGWVRGHYVVRERRSPARQVQRRHWDRRRTIRGW